MHGRSFDIRSFPAHRRTPVVSPLKNQATRSTGHQYDSLIERRWATLSMAATCRNSTAGSLASALPCSLRAQNSACSQGPPGCDNDPASQLCLSRHEPGPPQPPLLSSRTAEPMSVVICLTTIR
ncbi:hypothetical protein BD626DRAFT_510815 [Schizophyllum amplum]|uniref:Uncharacterized protein n=1 Tax=Schizophyllum amplum TaxID=97359 RepID=A0A550C1C6_9AGAR|nr:hypothetical protein BD626DRAFT_510815 [Auriculariopsis ampla]